MAEKKTTKAAATKATTEKKPAARKACGAKKEAAPKAEVKKEVEKKVAKKTVTTDMSAENVGFKAGDVYQTLAAAEKTLTVAEIAKAANITETEVLLGAGWLLKEGKITAEDGALKLL